MFWSKEENKLLEELLHMQKGKNWDLIQKAFPNRSAQSCYHHYKRLKLSEKIQKDWKFTEEEDKIIINLVDEYGKFSLKQTFKVIIELKLLVIQIKKQTSKLGNAICKNQSNTLSFINFLRPGLNYSKISEKEKQQILEYQKLYGNCWKKIASLLDAKRSNIQVKNIYYSSIKKYVSTTCSNVDSSNEMEMNDEDFIIIENK